nr:hypothetical protein [Tanacetum cinerariifolium]
RFFGYKEGGSKRTVKLNVEASGGETSSRMGLFPKKYSFCDNDGKPIKPCSHTQDEANVSVGRADKPILVEEEQMETMLLKEAAPTTFVSLVCLVKQALKMEILLEPTSNKLLVGFEVFLAWLLVVAGSFPKLVDAYGSRSLNSLAHKIHEIEKQLAEGKLVLCDNDESDNLFKNVGTSRTGNVNNNVQDESKVVEESESDAEDIYDRTLRIGFAIQKGDDDYDIYDNYDIQGLSKSNWCFVTRWIFVFEVLIDDKLYLPPM